MKPPVSVALVFRKNVVRSGGNGSGYGKVLNSLAEKAQYSVVATKNVHCQERMENQYEEVNIIGTSSTKKLH